jgi:uncharacterized protein YmfQ (DUF2313 family)
MSENNSMLSRITKKLGLSPDVNKEENMTTENIVEAASEVQALQAAFNLKSEELATALANIATLQATIDAYAQKEVQAQADALKAKMDARMSAIKANLGDDKAEAFMEATKGLDDAAFAAITSAMAGSLAAEAKSDMFVEVGVETKAEAPVEEEKAPLHFKNFIKKGK